MSEPTVTSDLTHNAPDVQVEIQQSHLYNEDIAPVPTNARQWGLASIATLWISMSACIPTYMLASSLIGGGMNWSQAIVTIFLGNAIVVIPMILNAHAGTKYGIPFPVFCRASFGTAGANVPAMLRAFVACGWFGIQTWIGGAAIYKILGVFWPALGAGAPLPVLGINFAQLTCFLFFWAINMGVIWRGIDTIRVLLNIKAPLLIALGLLLLWWAWRTAGGFGPILSQPSAFDAGQPKAGQFWSFFFPALTGMIGFWATLSLNIPDFTRYAKNQRDQVLGQALGLPTTMTLFAFISVAVTSATTVIFADPATGAPGEPIWDPTVLAGKIGGGFTVVLSLFALAVATLSTNIAANVVSPANALINAAPQRIGFRLGGYVTAGLGLVVFPWKLIETTDGYIFTWLVGYSALLGPIGGILVADYFVLRKTRLDLSGLYRHRGPYQYSNGWNRAALLALAIAVAPNLPGFLHAAGAVASVPAIFDDIYTYAWFVGFLFAGALYLGLMRVMYPASGPATEAEASGSPEDS